MADKQKPALIFGELFFPNIFCSFKIAIHPQSLIIASMAVCLIWTAGITMDFISKTVVVSGTNNNELSVYISNPSTLKSYIQEYEDSDHRQGVFKTTANFAFKKAHLAIYALLTFDVARTVREIVEYFKAISWAFKYHMIYCVIFFMIKLVIISIAGGALCRRAALKFSQDQQVGVIESLVFSLKRFKVFFTAPLTPVAIILCLGFIIIFLFGLITNIPFVGELLVVFFLPLQLLAGGIMTYLVVGAVAGFALMFPSIAYDGADSFDAMNRSLGYIYGKPLRLTFYAIIATVYGIICYMFVRLFAFLMLVLTRGFMQIAIFTDNRSHDAGKLDAIWPAPYFTNLLGTPGVVETNWSEGISGFIIRLFVLLISGVVVSFAVSYYFSVSTVIYSLMRKQVDNADIHEVYLEEDDSEAIDLTTEDETNVENGDKKADNTKDEQNSTQ